MVSVVRTAAAPHYSIIIIVDSSRSHSDTLNSVRHLWARDRRTESPLPAQHSQQTDILAPGGIRTPNPSKLAATDRSLISPCHWIWQILYVGSLFYVATVICHFPTGTLATLTQPTRPTAYRRGRRAAKSDKGYLLDKITSRVFGV